MQKEEIHLQDVKMSVDVCGCPWVVWMTLERKSERERERGEEEEKRERKKKVMLRENR